MNYIANVLTLCSLFCGFLSIILSLESHFTFAAWAIILSVVFDGLDGQVARRNPVPSELGKQLDSLVDVVAFGVAPSILGYVFIYKKFYMWAIVVLCAYLICSVWRLAKYNLTPKDKMVYNFIGLPTTASGAILAAFFLIYRRKEDMFIPDFVPHILGPQYIQIIFLVLVSILAYLMISRVKYLNMDGFKKLFGRQLFLAVFVAAGVIGAFGYLKKAGIAVFIFFLIYLIFSPFVVKRLNSVNR